MIQVLLEASKIPLFSVVTKKNGEQEYLIIDKVKIFSDGKLLQEINPIDGSRFLEGKNGNYN